MNVKSMIIIIIITPIRLLYSNEIGITLEL